MMTDLEPVEADTHFLASTYFSTSLGPEFFDELSKREGGKIQAPSDLKVQKEALIRILNNTGLSELARMIVREFHIIPAPDDFNFGGGYNRLTGDLRLFVRRGYLVQMLPVLIHELGHGLEQRLASLPEFPSELQEYIEIVMRSESQSPYAEAYALEKGRNDKDYVLEAFAEDFKYFWMNPEILDDNRAKLLKILIQKVFPEVNIIRLRAGVKTMIEEEMGLTVEQVIEQKTEVALAEARRKLVIHLKRTLD